MGCGNSLQTPTGAAARDSGGDGGAPATPMLYLVTGCGASACSGNDLVAIDVTAGKAVTDAPLDGTTAIAYRGGELLAARGSGYTRISVVDPDTLATTGTQLLPWDPDVAVFSPDGTTMYAAHDAGFVSQVRVADGAVTAELQVPPPAGSSSPTLEAIDGLALDPSGTLLAITSPNDGQASSVALVRISGQTLTVAFNWLSQPFATSNCQREASGPAFDLASAALATFDRNCGAFDVYDLSTGQLDPTASVLFARPDGSSLYSTTVADADGQFWAVNDGALYRTGRGSTSQQATFPFDPSTGGLVTDTLGATLYAFKGDPRTNGAFTVDLLTGAAAPEGWNLDLVPLGAEIAALTYAVR